MTTNEKRREVAATMMAISCRGVKDLTLGEYHAKYCPNCGAEMVE